VYRQLTEPHGTATLITGRRAAQTTRAALLNVCKPFPEMPHL
jgi:hypothetical protein